MHNLFTKLEINPSHHPTLWQKKKKKKKKEREKKIYSHFNFFIIFVK